MSLTGFLIGRACKSSAARFAEAASDPAGVQRQLLLSLVRKNADTEYGKRYDFAKIHDIEGWQARVPVVTYDDIKEDMIRVTEGAKGVFTQEDPVMFAQTSGTTGDPKFVPVTASCRGQSHSDVMRTWLFHSREAHRDIFDGKIVTLVSPAVEGHTPSGLPFGSTSGHMYRHQNFLIRRAYPVPYEAFEIEDYQAKYYAIMRCGLAHDVRFLATANPSSIIKMCEKADEFAESIIRDVRDGTISTEMAILPDIRQALARGLKPDPSRAKALEQARERRDGVLKPADYWPRLSLIGCWKGGTVGHYVSKFGAWFDPRRRTAGARARLGLPLE